MLILAQIAPWIVSLLVVGFVIISLMMILVVLVQRPQGGGLSEAFGSNSGSGHSAFGAKTGDALTTLTIGVFVAFIAMAVALNFVVTPGSAVADSGDETAATETDTSTAPGDDDAQSEATTGAEDLVPVDTAPAETPAEVETETETVPPAAPAGEGS